MIYIHKRCLVAFTAILFMMVMLGNHETFAEQAKSSDIIEINENQQSSEFYTDLDGEWYFFEKELLTPSEVEEQLSQNQGRTVTLPSSFETQTGDVNSFGTYSIKIKIPKEYVGETLAIHIPFQYSAYTLYINETEVVNNGQVGKDSATHVSEMAPETGYFIAESDEVLLTMQVSSFDHIRGGFENSIFIGEASVVAQKFNMSMLGTLFINGCIFIIGLFMVLFAL